ncbi:MAG TPA: HPP family protein [Gemmataceae bacterium]
MPDAETVAQSAARSSRGWGPVPEAVWSPLAGSFLVLLPGLFGLAVGRPLLFASLGPTLYIQVAQPQHPTSRFYNVVLGHLVGFAAATGAVLLLGAADDPSAFGAKHLPPARVWASVLAVAAALLVGVPLRVAFHPPAAATTLLVTLGGFRPTWSDFLTVAAGVLIVAVAGEVIRRLRLAQPGQK